VTNSSGTGSGQPACAHSVAWWQAELRRNGPVYAAERLCCEPVATFAEQRASPEPLYHALAMEYIAGRLNAGNTHVTSEQLVALRNAQLALETQCGAAGFLRPADRDAATTLLRTLQLLANEPCAEAKSDAAAAGGSATIADKCEPLLRGTELSELLCSGPPNRYIEVDQRCSCGALQHPGEPDCRHLACSGNGASLYDYKSAVERCACLPGWTGASCQRCDDAPVGTRYLCIGLPYEVGADRHVLRLVAASTSAARIDGNYYASSVAKAADALPGSAGLDCACRVLTDRVLPEHYETHYDAYEAATDATINEQLLWARSEAILDSAAKTSTAAAVVRVVKNAGAAPPTRRLSATLAILALFGLAYR